MNTETMSDALLDATNLLSRTPQIAAYLDAVGFEGPEAVALWLLGYPVGLRSLCARGLEAAVLQNGWGEAYPLRNRK
jgi:hypothetical protein